MIPPSTVILLIPLFLPEIANTDTLPRRVVISLGIPVFSFTNEIRIDDKGFPVKVITDKNLYRYEKLGRCEF